MKTFKEQQKEQFIAQNAAFLKAMSTAYAQPRKKASKPVKQTFHTDNTPKPVERDVINIQSDLEDRLEVIKHLNPNENYSEFIIDVVAVVSGFRKSEIKSPRRFSKLVHWRHIAAWVLKEHTGASLPSIANRLGGRDHTTILSCLRKIETNMDIFRADIQRVERLL